VFPKLFKNKVKFCILDLDQEYVVIIVQRDIIVYE